MRDIFCTRDNFALYAHVKSHLLYGNPDACKNPVISVLMPVYCHPNYFYEALQSVINQDCSFEYEIIIVDNNDLDGKENKYQQIVNGFAAPNVFYYRNEKNIGMFGNWNRCIELARAPYVTFCHDDDMLLPTALTRLMFLQEKTQGKAIFPDTNILDKNGNYIHDASKNKWKRLLKRKDYCDLSRFDLFMRCQGTGEGCLYNRQCLIEIGGYDEEFYPGADYVMDINYTYRYGSVRSSPPVYDRRHNGENTTVSICHLIADLMKHCRHCMLSKLPYPKWFLNRIITAAYNVTKAIYDKDQLYKAPLNDRFIMKLIYMLLSLKRYKL